MYTNLPDHPSQVTDDRSERPAIPPLVNDIASALREAGEESGIGTMVLAGSD
jgi:hypothetical protein